MLSSSTPLAPSSIIRRECPTDNQVDVIVRHSPNKTGAVGLGTEFSMEKSCNQSNLNTDLFEVAELLRAQLKNIPKSCYSYPLEKK